MSSSGWSDSERLVLRACIGLVKTAVSSTRKLTKSISVSGRSDDHRLTTELDTYVVLMRAVSPVVDELVSSLYPPVNIHTVLSQVSTVHLSLSLSLSLSKEVTRSY